MAYVMEYKVINRGSRLLVCVMLDEDLADPLANITLVSESSTTSPPWSNVSSDVMLQSGVGAPIISYRASTI